MANAKSAFTVLLCLLTYGTAHIRDDHTATGLRQLLTPPNESSAECIAAQTAKNLVQVVETCDIDKLQMLLDAGAKVNQIWYKNHWYETALHAACRLGNDAKVLLLLGRHADVDALNSVGEMPLHDAAREGHDSVVSLLLQNYAYVNANGFADMTPLHYAAMNGRTAAVSVLLQNYADMNAKENSGATPLHLAAMRGMDSTASVLLQNGANVNAKNYAYETPLHAAAMGGFESVVPVLLQSGADIDANDQYGQTSLHFAARNNQVAMLQRLLLSNAFVNARTYASSPKPWWTALHMAAEGGYLDAVEILLQHGADPTIRTKDGKTALSIATSKGYAAIVALLNMPLVG